MGWGYKKGGSVFNDSSRKGARYKGFIRYNIPVKSMT